MLRCHLEGSQQAEELGLGEFHEFQQGEMHLESPKHPHKTRWKGALQDGHWSPDKQQAGLKLSAYLAAKKANSIQ